MAHHEQGPGTAGGLAPRIGVMSALVALALPLAALWVVVKHPRLAVKGLAAAAVFAVVGVALPLQDAKFGVLAILVGVAIAGGQRGGK